MTYEDRIAFQFSDMHYGSHGAGGVVVSCLESKIVMVRYSRL
jgi:hypothetical protein